MLKRLRQERLLLILLTALPVLTLLSPMPVRDLSGLVHWNTLAALAGLMMLSRALEISGGLAAAGRWLVVRLHGERSLALCLVLFAAALSTVLTNDVALFITVPLTLGLRLVARLPLARLVVFQAPVVLQPDNYGFSWSVSVQGKARLAVNGQSPLQEPERRHGR